MIGILVFREYLNEICSIFYDTLRPRIVKLHHIETLSEISSTVRIEMVENESSGDAASNSQGGQKVSNEIYIKTLNQLWQDTEERLIYRLVSLKMSLNTILKYFVFRANIYVKNEIQDYQPHAGDLLYPENLEMMRSISESASSGGELFCLF